MTNAIYHLSFSNYGGEENYDSLPTNQGVYAVYAGCYLVYIGESGNVQKRVRSHKYDKLPCWQSNLQNDELLDFWVADTNKTCQDRLRAEAAMIYKHKPECNTEYVNCFPFNDTDIHISNDDLGMCQNFTVEDTRTP